MMTVIHIPTTQLAEAVECFYMNKAVSFEMRELNIPILHQELFFNLGDTFEMTNLAQTFHTRNMTSWFTGLHTKPTSTFAKGKHVSVGVLFKPWGFYQAFGVHAREIANDVIAPEGFLHERIHDFLAENVDTLQPVELLKALETHLLAYYKSRPIKYQVIQLIEKLQISGFKKGSMQKLASTLKISSKTFIDTFNTSIGINPVKYHHLQCISLAMKQINLHPAKSLTEIGLELGFYDQAHFIRVFKSFYGMSPRNYRSKVLQQRKFCTISQANRDLHLWT
jgi:AraC-like DNA-binding protein